MGTEFSKSFYLDSHNLAMYHYFYLMVQEIIGIQRKILMLLTRGKLKDLSLVDSHMYCMRCLYSCLTITK